MGQVDSQAALYYGEHFQIVNSINKDDVISFETARKYIEQLHIQTQLIFIKSNFWFLVNAKTCLAKQGMTHASAVSIVEDAKIKSTQIGGVQGKTVKTVNRNSIAEKRWLMVKIFKMLSGKQENFLSLPVDLKLINLVFLYYVPITSINTLNVPLQCIQIC